MKLILLFQKWQSPEVRKVQRLHTHVQWLHTCAVAICRLPKDASYHRFPKAEPLSKAWLNACRRKDFVNVKTAYVCSEHFQEQDFERDLRGELMNLPSRRMLKRGWSLSAIYSSLIVRLLSIIMKFIVPLISLFC